MSEAVDTFIEVFEGRLGGGKSYSAVERIFTHLISGGIVYTNIRLKWDAIKKSALNRGLSLDDNQYQYLTNAQVIDFNRHVAPGTDHMPALVVLDEAHLFFNARDWNKTGRVILDMMTQMRKVKLFVILITQSHLNLDKQFVRMIQFLWRFRDMRKLTIPFIGIKWPLKQILQVCYDAQDSRQEMARRLVFKNPEVFGWYDSKAMFTDLQLLTKAPEIANFKRLTAKERRQVAIGRFRQIASDIRKSLTPRVLMKFAVVLFLVVVLGVVGLRHLMASPSQPVAALAVASPTQHTNAKPHFLGGGLESRKDGFGYHSSLTAFVPDYGPVRVGSKFGDRHVRFICPQIRSVILDDGTSFSY